jgi:DNA polymerase elongation subunit (family B)
MRAKRHILSHRSKVEQTSTIPFIAIDTENDGSVENLTGGFECAYAYGEIREFHELRFGSKRKLTSKVVPFERLFTTREELLKFIRELKKTKNNKPCHLVFFNGGYDYPFIRPECNDEKLLLNSSFIVGETNNGIKIWDIQRHAVVGSLGDWMKRLKLEEKGIEKKSLDDKQARCRDDAKATWELTMYFKRIYDSMGVNMKLTMSSTALSYFQHEYMQKDDGTPLMFERLHEEWGEFARESYYGGRSEVFSRGLQICSWYDINSTYVSVMRDEVLPDPQSIRNVNSPGEDWREHYDNYLGIYDVTVEIPMMHYPPLPVRTPDTKLIFPVGTIRGVWTTVDLKAAEEQGCKILKCHRYLWYKLSLPLLKGFAEECWNNRKKAVLEGGKGCVEEIFWKTFGNALYGKLAQRIPKNGYLGKLSQYKGGIPTTDLKSWDEDGESYISIAPDSYEESSFAFVELSSFIAAYARRKLMSSVWSLEKAGFITTYVDTDSIKVTTREQTITDAIVAKMEACIDVGNDLGQWKYEGEPDVFYFRPKWYAEIESRGNSNTPPTLVLHGAHTKMKGIGKHANIDNLEWERRESDGEWVLKSVTATDHRPYKMRESAARGKPVNFWRDVTKTLENDDTKRNWENDDSYPLVWDSENQCVIDPPNLSFEDISKGLGE